MEFYHKKLLLDQFTPVSIYQKIKNLYKHEVTFLFESTINSNEGNYSFIVIGCRERVWYKDNKCFHEDEKKEIKEISSNPLRYLQKYYKKFDKKIYKNKAKELGIGFVDGFIGNIGFDIIKEFEPILKKSMNNLKDQLNISDVDLIRPKIILGFSHKTSKLIMITSLKKCKDALEKIEKELYKPSFYTPLKKATIIDKGKFNYTKEEFFEMIKKSKEFIKKGDIFQILMSNRFIQKAKVDPLSFYRVLRSKNPSPYLFFLEYEDFCIAGSSPEVMVKLVDNHILLRPVAGTRKRGKDIYKERQMKKELQNDPKEKAEHIMLVDLGRNDVSRVARTGSVNVTSLMRIEKYSHVMHIVSDIEAIIDDKFDMFDLFMSTFTAGTMTGTPKISSIQLIAKLEGIKRNFYSGSIAYFGFDGNMDSAITIRTTLLTKDKVVFQAGAGIVEGSIDELEYLEVQNKLAANIAALEKLS